MFKSLGILPVNRIDVQNTNITLSSLGHRTNVTFNKDSCFSKTFQNERI